LNPSLYIISRGNQPESEQKMRIAGANHVINPYTITGHRMVAQLLHPGAVEFLEVIMRHGNLELRIEEIIIGADSVIARQSLGDAKIRSATGVNVLAVRHSDGSLFTQLDPEFTLAVGDALVCLGTAEQLTALAERAAERRKWLK
jgi:voltage-gated potassium channel